MNAKGPPFHFSALCDVFEVFSKKKFQKIFFRKNFQNFFCFQSGKVIFQSYRAWKAHFGCLESVFKAFHENILGIFRKLCAFWALDYSADFRRSRLVRQLQLHCVFIRDYRNFEWLLLPERSCDQISHVVVCLQNSWAFNWILCASSLNATRSDTFLVDAFEEKCPTFTVCSFLDT